MLKTVEIRSLFEDSGDKSHFKYSEEVELQLSKMVFGKSRIKEISEGYAPWWDFKLSNDKTIELKIQSSKDPYIEIQQRIGDTIKDSGFSLSKADYWLILNTGSIKTPVGWKKVMKIRIFSRTDIENSVTDDTEIVQKYSTIGFKVDHKVTPFINVGHIEMNEEDGISLDLTKIKWYKGWSPKEFCK